MLPKVQIKQFKEIIEEGGLTRACMMDDYIILCHTQLGISEITIYLSTATGDMKKFKSIKSLNKYFSKHFQFNNDIKLVFLQ